ncbi:MAG: hypothetical protein QME81_13035 [bacterium]|nr:hypothetical protein [bacterium]
MEQDREVKAQGQAVEAEWVAAADKEWVADKAEWVVRDWGLEEIVFAPPVGQSCPIKEEFPVHR